VAGRLDATVNDRLTVGYNAKKLGSNVKAGYFAQNRLENLNPKLTVLEEAMSMRDENPEITERLARTILGGFLFRKDDVFKRVSVLSGGEKSRLALAKLLLAPPNLLLMDEPTTHLDIASTDALINALRQFEGTLIFISHDVYCIRALANQVLHVHSGRLTPYAGNYDYYLEKSRATNERVALTAGLTDARPRQLKAQNSEAETNAPAARTGPKTKEQKRAEAAERNARTGPVRALRAKVSELEKEIFRLEKSQAELTSALEAPETYAEPGKAQHLNRELSTTVDRLQTATTEWEQAASQLAELEK